MEIFNINSFMLTFKILCGIVTLFMVGYWVHKFNKNEDVSLVQYISLDTMAEVIHPETTVCIFKPFFVQAFKDQADLNHYLEYLNGNGDPKINTKASITLM